MQNKEKQKNTAPMLLAVEGGGTNCRVILGTAAGQEIDRIKIAKTANIAYGDGSEATQNIIDGLFTLSQKHKIDIQRAHIALCLAGVSHTENRAKLQKAFQRAALPAPVLQSDAIAGVLAIDSDISKPRAIAIAGTGSILMGLKDDKIYRSLGRGFPEGIFSGSIIGYDSLGIYAKAPQSCKSPKLKQVFEDMIAAHSLRHKNGRYDIKAVQALQANYYAELFPALLQHYRTTQDAHSAFKNCIDTHLNAYVDVINHFSADSGIKDFAFVGSVAESFRDQITQQVHPKIHFQSGAVDALRGALNFALLTKDAPDALHLTKTPTITVDKFFRPEF